MSSIVVFVLKQKEKKRCFQGVIRSCWPADSSNHNLFKNTGGEHMSKGGFDCSPGHETHQNEPSKTKSGLRKPISPVSMDYRVYMKELSFCLFLCHFLNSGIVQLIPSRIIGMRQVPDCEFHNEQLISSTWHLVRAHISVWAVRLAHSERLCKIKHHINTGSGCQCREKSLQHTQAIKEAWTWGAFPELKNKIHTQRTHENLCITRTH